MAGIEEERAQQRSFLETAAGEAHEFHEKVEARQHEARAAAEEVYTAERELGRRERRHAMHLLTLAGNARNSIVQGEESLAALEREAERLEGEMGQAHIEQENLGVQTGESRQRFDAADATLKRLEEEIATLRESAQSKRTDEGARRGPSQPTARRTGSGGGTARLAARADPQSWLRHRHGAAAAEAGGAGAVGGAGGHAGGLC